MREQYRREPRTLAQHTARLSQLRPRFNRLLDTDIAAVVDRFDELNDVIRRAEQEREFWRDELIRRCAAARTDGLRGARATVRVRASQAVDLPAAGTAERFRLDQAIVDAGEWPAVSQLSRPRLQQALETGTLAPALTKVVRELCPARVAYTVSSRPIAGAGASSVSGQAAAG